MDEKYLLTDSPWVAKALGSLAGVLLSMAMIAPEGTKNAFYRCVLGTIAGVVFTPTVQRLVPFLSGNTWEDWLAAATAAGFSCWFILESLARLLSQRDTIDKLFREILKLRKADKE